MLLYESTRGGCEPQSFSDAVLTGLAPDGGLYWPQYFLPFTMMEYAALRGASYQKVALAVMARFAPEIPALELSAMINEAYTPALFGSEEITPIFELEPGLYLHALSGGPTLAFKDLAMQLLSRLMERTLARENRETCIVAATSGDTGSAAENAFLRCEHAHVVMLSPQGRMSDFQRRQMYTNDHPRIHNLAVDGTFDDCQGMVKVLNADAAFKEKYAIGAVNSINIARLAAQTAYVLYACLKMPLGVQVSIAVPSGNFGNALSVYLAKKFGAPIRRIIIATNENDVLHQFFETGIYKPRAKEGVFATTSPSMDIAEASNLERLIYQVLGRNAAKVRELYADVRQKGFDLRALGRGHERELECFVSGMCTQAEGLRAIQGAYAKYSVLLDPHTAVGYRVGLAHRELGVPLIVMQTALAEKFRDTIRTAVGFNPPLSARYADLFTRPERFTSIPPDPNAVKEYIATKVQFKTVR